MNDHSDHEPIGFAPLAQHYMKDLIYGANDGIITTFAVVSGVTGAALAPQIAIILGIANLLADGFSMAASNFLSIQSDEAVRRHAGLPASEPFPVRHAAVTFSAFVIAGAVPLLSYVVPLPLGTFTMATILTLSALFLVGAARALVTDLAWLRAGVQMMAVGAVAALVAYWVGAWIEGLIR